ncbi:MAG: hypothetical protein ACR2ND_10430 [Solirubrobacteraceae bacterium]
MRVQPDVGEPDAGTLCSRRIAIVGLQVKPAWVLVHSVMAFIGLPVAVFATCSGLGLLADRVTRARLPNELLAPVGFCVAVSLMLSVFTLGGHSEAAVVVLVASSAAGFALAGASARRAIQLGWCAVAALAVYILYILPEVGTGSWNWLGYNFLNDTSVQFGLIEHLKQFGTDAARLPMSTGGESLRTYFASGYPLGTHAYAASLSGLLGQPIEVLYQSFLAALAAIAAMALSVVARSLTGARTSAALAAVALGSNLTYQYALQGSIKEIGVIAAVCAAAGVLTALARASSPVGLAAVLGLCLSAVLAVYNAAGIPYVGALGATAIVTVLLTQGRVALGRRWLLAAVLAIGVTVAASTAAILTLRQFYDAAVNTVSSNSPMGSSLGQLAHPLGVLQVAGVWLKGRYFEPIEPNTLRDTLTVVAAWLIMALVVLAAVGMARRRRPEAAAAVAPLLITAIVVAPRVSPYAQAKLLAILSPAIVLTAGLGLTFVWRRARPIAIVVGAGLLTAIGVSDGFAYHDDKPAPQARLVAIKDAVEHTPGTGLILFNEFEEFAKYFDPTGRVNVTSESITPRPVLLLRPVARFGQFFDLDLQRLDYVQSFDNIILRRSPVASRPPGSFRRVFENRFYEVWSRDRAQPAALLQLPLGNSVTSAAGTASCPAVKQLVAKARGIGRQTSLLAAQPPETIVFDVAHAQNRSPGWPPNGGVPGTLTVPGSGQAQGVINVAHPGRFFVWVRGDLPHPVRVQIDGRDIGKASGVNTPGQWLPVGSVSLGQGRKVVRAYAGGGTLRPGDGALGLIGPVALVREEPAKLLRVSLGNAPSLCGKQLDWIEVVP